LQHPLDNDKLLIGTNKLFSFDKKTEKFDELLDLKQESEIPNNLINAFEVDPGNNELLWIATGDLWGRGTRGGLIKFNLNNKRSNIFNTENRPDEIPDKHLLDLCFNGKNHLWIGTRNEGALLYNKKEDRFYNYKKNNLDSESFVTSTAVLAIKKDRSGTLWFGTWGQGIAVLSPGTQKFTHYKHVPNSKDGLLDNNINTFAEDKNGDIWIGTFKGGLSKFDPRTKSFKHYFNEFISDENNSVEITHLLYDSKDNLWIGTYKNALYRYNPETGIKTHYKMGTSKKNVSQTRITTVSELKLGEILVTTYGGGLNIYNYDTDSFKHYLNKPNDSTSIPDNQIWFPFKGPDNNYYFCGNSWYGFFKFEPDKEIFSGVRTSSKISTFIMPVKNPSGNIYINDVANGMRELVFGEIIKVNSIVDINGQQMDYESLLIDTENRLWLGTVEGLIEFDPELGISRRYDIDDGIQGFEYLRYSALKASSGAMYFGGTNGFNVFYPDEIRPSKFKPNIVFTDFKLFQESVSIGENSVLTENISLVKELKLKYDQNDFTISFAALDFSNPKKNKYKYILENHDEDWIDAGHKSYASYTNMDPGNILSKY
jgi:sugar lactone lactonase YvrE